MDEHRTENENKNNKLNVYQNTIKKPIKIQRIKIIKNPTKRLCIVKNKLQNVLQQDLSVYMYVCFRRKQSNRQRALKFQVFKSYLDKKKRKKEEYICY